MIIDISWLVSTYSELLSGLWVTLKLTIFGISIGFLLGIPIAYSKVYGGKGIRQFANAYTDIFRGTPLLVQLFLIYYGLPDFGITFSRITAAIIALGLNSAAYQAEYFRGAILSIGDGQMLAARSIGMTRFESIRSIILPQALRIVIPAWTNEPISLLKATGVVFLIAVPDIMTKAKIIISRTYDPIKTYLAVALVYVVIVLILTAGLSVVERKLSIPGLKIDASRR